VNQLEIQGREHNRIPDGIVYINGIPLVVLELKSAIKENTTIEDAYKQLTVRYRRDIPELFKYNAFVVISDGVNNKIGSLFSPYEYFYAWRKVESTDREVDGISSLITMVKELVDDKTRYTDWDVRIDVKAELEADLMILLDENGYPPVPRNEVYNEVFEQAENFKKYQD
jgi:hypothetical protein